jgi:dolichol-phosphate mannosyltransferase
VVYGRRGKREGSKVLELACRAFYRIFRRVSEVPMPLDAGDFSLMDRKVVDHLLAMPETDQFVRGLRTWVGFKQTGVDYHRPQRAFGRSTHNWLKNVWWAKKAIFSFSYLPLEILGYSAAVLTALSFLAGVYEMVDRLRRPELPHGISTIIVLILFLGSLNLLAVSLVGEYVIRILDEAKRRPKFIRKAIRHGGKHFGSAGEIERLERERQAQYASQR